MGNYTQKTNQTNKQTKNKNKQTKQNKKTKQKQKKKWTNKTKNRFLVLTEYGDSQFNVNFPMRKSVFPLMLIYAGCSVFPGVINMREDTFLGEFPHTEIHAEMRVPHVEILDATSDGIKGGTLPPVRRKKILRSPRTASVACRRGLWIMHVNIWPRSPHLLG